MASQPLTQPFIVGVLGCQFSIAESVPRPILGNRGHEIKMIESKVWILDRIGAPNHLTAFGHLPERPCNVWLGEFSRPDAHDDFAQQERPLTVVPKKSTNGLDVCQRTRFLKLDRSAPVNMSLP